ncbi:MAG: 4Fe-4S dicluster domain-containing protein [Dehalococcoidia bacterium]|nr:4Fe-4S dicluster domain-containing protein [Dehalococcoidia bacterium]MDP6782769.1 4Fe-4S dicluster domain-containing protein [Dehalococcoidia bacterium]
MQTTVVPSSDFRIEVERESGESISSCYQCGKCTAGCPAALDMDGGPRWLLRAVQLGMRDEALNSATIWMCLFCAACQARCPAGIDIPKVLETVRHLSLKENRPPASKEVALFQRLFLGQVAGMGRVHELTLGGTYNLRSGHLMSNVGLVPRMLARRKLSLLPHRKGARWFKRLLSGERKARD